MAKVPGMKARPRAAQIFAVIIAGIIAIFVLAIVVDTLIMLAGKLATPWIRIDRRVKAGAK